MRWSGRRVFGALLAATVIGACDRADPPTPQASPPSSAPASDPAPVDPARVSVPAEREGESARDAVRRWWSDRGHLLFLDLSYYVDVRKLGDSRWNQTDPPHARATEDKGMQLRVVWSANQSAEGGNSITVSAHKLIHKERVGQTNTYSEFSYPFEAIGKKPLCSDVDGMLEGFYENWKATAKDVNEKACKAPRRSSAGPAEAWATCTGTDAESKKLERREWYVWRSANVTWMVEVVYDQALLGSEEILKKGGKFVSAIKELRDRRLR